MADSESFVEQTREREIDERREMSLGDRRGRSVTNSIRGSKKIDALIVELEWVINFRWHNRKNI